MTVSQASRALPLVGETPRRPQVVIEPLKDAIGRAALAAGLSTEGVYRSCEIEQSQWSRAVRTGHVPLGKLLMLAQFPPHTPEGKFWAAFRPELDALIGAPPKGKAAIVREALMAVSQLVVALTCEDDDARRSA